MLGTVVTAPTTKNLANVILKETGEPEEGELRERREEQRREKGLSSWLEIPPKAVVPHDALRLCFGCEPCPSS